MTDRSSKGGPFHRIADRPKSPQIHVKDKINELLNSAGHTGYNISKISNSVFLNTT